VYQSSLCGSFFLMLLHGIKRLEIQDLMSVSAPSILPLNEFASIEEILHPHLERNYCFVNDLRDPLHLSDRLIKATMEDKNLRKLLLYLSFDLNAYNLYKVYECLEVMARSKNVKLPEMTGTSGRKVSKLTQALNSSPNFPPRHSAAGSNQPKMGIQECRLLIHQMSYNAVIGSQMFE
jgi:hypothetical protein